MYFSLKEVQVGSLEFTLNDQELVSFGPKLGSFKVLNYTEGQSIPISKAVTLYIIVEVLFSTIKFPIVSCPKISYSIYTAISGSEKISFFC